MFKLLFWGVVFTSLTLIYVYGIRPKIRARPEFQEYFYELDMMHASLWERIKLRLKGWKNFLFGMSLIIVPLITEILEYLKGTDLTGYLSPQSILVVTPLLGLAIIILRVVTTTAIGQKEPEA